MPASGGPEVERLIALLAKLPGLGPRSARRVALRLLQSPEQRLRPLVDALQSAERAVRPCRICANLDSTDPCSICADPSRQPTICAVEQVSDLWALERAHAHRGTYHVLGGTLSALSGVGPDDLRIASLVRRAEAGEATEIILALSATVDGATTQHYIASALSPSGVRVTQLAQGVPIGGALDVLDDGTLAAAFRARATAVR